MTPDKQAHPLTKVFRPPMRGVFPFSIRSLFSANETGVWCDPSDLTTLLTDAAGTTNVTTPGQTVALLLDKSKGLVRGPELVTNGAFDGVSPWENIAGGTPTNISGGVATLVGSSNQWLQQRGFAFEVGKYYEFSVDIVSESSPGALLYLYMAKGTFINSAQLLNSSSADVTNFVGKTFTVRFTPNSTGYTFIVLKEQSGVHSITIDNVSVRELPGNHAFQATAGDRPTFTGDRALENVSSDSINWVAPAGTYTVAYRGSTGTVILDAQSLSGATNIMQATKIYEYIAVDRALGSAEKRQLQAYLDHKGT